MVKTYDLLDISKGYDSYFQMVESVDHTGAPDGMGDYVRREEVADQVETLSAYKERARRLFECLEALAERCIESASQRHPLDIDDSYLNDARELISECTALTAVESAGDGEGQHGT